MNPHPVEKRQRTIITEGYAILEKEKQYSGAAVVRKITYLGFKISASALSNILKEKNAGSDSLKSVSAGMDELVYKELGFRFDNKKNKFIAQKDGWEPTIIPEDKNYELQEGFHFYDAGRRTILDKTNFFADTQKTMYEFGVTLNTFSSYFFNRNRTEFKQPIIKLLKRGVHIKCYLLDPNSSEAMIYFNDRANVRGFEKEKNNNEKIKDVLSRLKTIHEEFAGKHPGKFEVYTYKHLPTNYFLAIDPEEEYGKMTISHYLYGQLRANNPVFEFTKHSKPELFDTYWVSLQEMIRNARRVDF